MRVPLVAFRVFGGLAEAELGTTAFAPYFMALKLKSGYV
jgi:hypothetical protein